MDLTDSIAPKSDQMNAEDLLTGPRTFTVAEVKKGTGEQPVDIHLVEFPGRPFRPSKTVRRILVNAWGPDASAYVGRRMTLYRDPSVKFGGMDVGGIRVSHLSHIDKPLSVALTVSRGKRHSYTVQPLAAEARTDSAPDVAGGEASASGAVHPETAGNFQAMQIKLRQRFGNDRDAVIAWVGSQVGREIGSTTELDAREVTHVLAVLNGARREAATA